MKGFTQMYKGLVFISVPTVIWGVGAVLISELIGRFHSFQLVLAIRFIHAGLLFVFLGGLPWFKINLQHLIHLAKDIRILLIGVVYLPLTLYFIFWGIEVAGPGLTALVWNSYPLLGIIIGKLVFRDRLLKAELIGNTILFFISVIWSFTRYEIAAHWIGIVVGMASVLVYLTGLVLVRKHIKEAWLREFNLLSILLGGILGFGYIVLFSRDILVGNEILRLFLDLRFLYLTVLMTVVANILYSKSMYYLELSEVTMFTYLQSVITVILESLTKYSAPINIQDKVFILLILLGFIISLYGIRQEFTNAKDKIRKV